MAVRRTTHAVDCSSCPACTDTADGDTGVAMVDFALREVRSFTDTGVRFDWRTCGMRSVVLVEECGMCVAFGLSLQGY